jgi:polyisoprenoid-binding protein YceI
LQDIEADNNQVISVLNIKTGELQFSLLNSAFHFPKAKMEEDFNENYIESNKYPRSGFKGMVTDINQVDFTKDGTYPVTVKGDLTIHGITKMITAKGSIIVSKGTISAISSFTVFVKDYGIKIPTIVSNKIAERIQISVNCSYQEK